MSGFITRMEAVAELLEQGYDPDDISLQQTVEHVLRGWINHCCGLARWRGNVEDETPEWYAVQAYKTELHEGLHGVLSDVLGCDAAETCTRGIFHEGACWDGEGWVKGS